MNQTVRRRSRFTIDQIAVRFVSLLAQHALTVYAARENTHAYTPRCIDRCESLSHLRETDPRNVHPRRASECITVAHRDGFPPCLPSTPRREATRGDAKRERRRRRREMHSCGNASCHSRRLPRDNKLSGLCIGRKQRRTSHMQNTCAPQVPRAPELVFVVPGAKTRPVVSSEK